MLLYSLYIKLTCDGQGSDQSCSYGVLNGLLVLHATTTGVNHVVDKDQCFFSTFFL